MSSETKTLVDLVKEIKTAIQDAQGQNPEILIAKAECELKTGLVAGPSGFIELGPIKIGGKYAESEIQTLSLSLTPVPPTVELFGRAADALTQGIAAISKAATEAASSAPRFGLDGATVEIKFGVDANGKIEFVIGGGVERNTAHTLKLTLKKKA